MFETGAICRSKAPIMKCADEEQGHVSAFRRVNELALVRRGEAPFSEQQLGLAGYTFVASASMAAR